VCFKACDENAHILSLPSVGFVPTFLLLQSVLTSAVTSSKTENVSESDYRRVSPVASIFDDAHETFPIPPAKAPRRCATQSRAHSGGGQASVHPVRRQYSLDDIAKQAGVGAGTLYRHFPTRDELLEAVYRTEVEKLAAAERKYAEDISPIEALRAWMLLFVDYIANLAHAALAL
jgi:hypothetical protein